jgi:L-ascorbate metabolism protein UlaG (beta-lactamase superfamily)
MTTYRNLDGTTPDKGLGAVLKWKLGQRARKRGGDSIRFVAPRRTNDGVALTKLEPHLTWIGHATFVLRLGGKLIATDPLWSPRVGVFNRLTVPGVAIENVPPLDVVTVSHSHYDHLDLPSLQRIGPAPLYVVPRDVGEILRAAGLPRVVELGWWESHVEGELRITLVPSQHWSMRVPWDRNKRLWGGFVYESPEGTGYHAGDTALSEQVFLAIAERFPRIDWAMLPIGAYEPEWFMRPQHMNPEDAARAWEILGARVLCAMHWGTLKLTDEPPGEPPERLRTLWNNRGEDPERLWIFDVGETRMLGGAAVDRR